MTALSLARITAVRDGGRLLRFALRLDAAGSGALGLVGLALPRSSRTRSA